MTAWNPALHKDLSILVVDGQYGFGNNRVMPAGPLREPVEEVIKRVQAIAVIGTVSDLYTICPTTCQSWLLASCRRQDDDISGRPVVAFAGIGRPEKFSKRSPNGMRSGRCNTVSGSSLFLYR